MDVVETALTWILLFATAAVGGGLIWLALTRLVEQFSLSRALPALLGTAAGLFVGWFLIDPISFDSTRTATPFTVSLFAGAAVLVATSYVARKLLVSNQAVFAIGLGISLLAAVASWIIGSPSTIAGFAVVVVIFAFVLAITAAPGFSDQIRQALPLVGGVATLLGLIDALQAYDRMGRVLNGGEMDSIAATLWAVALAVGGSCLLFVAMNLLLNHSQKQWSVFSALAGAAIGFVVFGVLDGNRLLKILGPRESVATNLHDLVNNGPWTLLISCVLIGLVFGWLYEQMNSVIRETEGNRHLGMVGGAILGAVWGVLFIDRIPVDTTVRVLWTALLGAIVCGAAGYVISLFPDDRNRAAISVGMGVVIGLLIGSLLKTVHQPRLETLPLVLAPLIVGVVGAGLSWLRGRSVVTGAATGALFGWLAGTFGFPTLNGGPEIETLLATGVAGGLFGLRYGAKPFLDSVERDQFQRNSRTSVFLGPAMSFIAVGLVIPLIRTLYLSVYDKRTVEFVALDNYQTVFTKPEIFDYTDRLDIFGSRLFQIGALLIVFALGFGIVRSARTGNTIEWGKSVRMVLGPILLLAALLEYVVGRQTDGEVGGNWLVIVALAIVGIVLLAVPLGKLAGQSVPKLGVDFDGAASAMVGAGIFFIAFAVFSALRGTVINNVWWVFTVTLLATGMGMAVAVLADKAKNENVAKSFIFMPLAISFVGAGIIWKFMYVARPASRTQTGVMNYFWTELGRYSTEASTARTVSIILLTLALVGFMLLFLQGAIAKAKGVMGSSALLGLFMAFVLYRFTIGTGIGGIAGEGPNGEVRQSIILFLTESQPFNNLWLMIVLIWIQTGFAMVIFSAAIKAVPAEYVEASRVDGATESQVFWKITLPSIVPTIGVVVTTLIVSVMKVFDIPKVMTNGNFDTQVVANEMWQQAFTNLDFGLGSALAIVLFLSVVPVMYYNIRNMQKGV